MAGITRTLTSEMASKTESTMRRAFALEKSCRVASSSAKYTLLMKGCFFCLSSVEKCCLGERVAIPIDDVFRIASFPLIPASLKAETRQIRPVISLDVEF